MMVSPSAQSLVTRCSPLVGLTALESMKVQLLGSDSCEPSESRDPWERGTSQSFELSLAMGRLELVVMSGVLG